MERLALVEESRRRVEESRQLAAASLEDLQLQHEALQGVDRVLDQSEDLLHRSLRLLRGMSWTGRLVNLIEQATSTSGARRDLDEQKPFRETILPPTPSQPGAIMEASDRDPADESTRALSRSVKELRAAGELIASRVRANNALLDRVAMKQDVALEKTYELTRQTSRVHSQGGVSEPGFILHALGDFDFYGRHCIFIPPLFSFMHIHRTDPMTGCFLTADQGHLSLASSEPSPATLFTVYLCAEGSFHVIQSKLSSMYLGPGSFNRLSLSSTLERSQRLSIQHFGEDEHRCGILALAGNWGKGGWLQRNFTVSRGIKVTENRLDLLMIPATSRRNRLMKERIK